MSDVPQFRVRAATAADLRACRMLLPKFFALGSDVILFVAIDSESEWIIGAGAISWDDPMLVDGSRPIAIQVIAPWRRRGVGRALLERISNDAVARNTPGIFVLHWLDLQSPYVAALRSMGFEPQRRRFQYEGRIKDGLPALAGLYQGIIERNWIPKSAKIISLSEADIKAVAKLHLKYLGGNRADLLSSLRGGPPGYFDRTSFVLTLDGAVVGFNLGRMRPAEKVCEIDSTVVDPSLRLGWANLWMRYHAGVWLLEHGIERVRYRALEEHTDTRRTFRRGKTKLIATEVLMHKSFER